MSDVQTLRVRVVYAYLAKGHAGKCYACSRAGKLWAVKTVVEGERTMGPFGKEQKPDGDYFTRGNFHFSFMCQVHYDRIRKQEEIGNKRAKQENETFSDYLKQRAEERRAKRQALVGLTGRRGS